jgi:glutamate N-acetyltransferase/amino-acid N-acetyltransferase
MAGEIKTVEGGTVTSPKGLVAGAVYAGLKTYAQDKVDLGILMSKQPASVAGTFTTNKLRSPSCTLSVERAAKGKARAVVVNSGIANACVGEQGYKDAVAMAKKAASHIGVKEDEVLTCSTGLIGVELPMALINTGIEKIKLTEDGGHMMARAIITTDTRTKETAVAFKLNGKTVTVGGMAKGSGMIHPNMATMLAFVTTDAEVAPALLRTMLKEAVDVSFNMITVDGDSSTNDTVLVLANGASGAGPIAKGTEGAKLFQKALTEVCTYLAKEIARDGEGATKLIEVTVEGAKSEAEARSAARTIASSSLVKTAVHGNDPNWGRVVAALGRSECDVEEGKIALYINEVCIMESGTPIAFHKDSIVASMSGPNVSFRIKLNLGKASATAWGCNMSEEYVTFNSAYHT